ncbi:hypothetical protein A2U01_0002418 [Trifolium medium]|uniref:Uncharacterized protein n=1 Tax=Trifolium medium TaxID=97028 RepID=A0A392M2Q7_9FABA|nr:hypothetical protein [Trifolium medium]
MHHCVCPVIVVCYPDDEVVVAVKEDEEGGAVIKPVDALYAWFQTGVETLATEIPARSGQMLRKMLQQLS